MTFLALGHMADLWFHTTSFIKIIPARAVQIPQIEALVKEVGTDFRVGVDSYLRLESNREFDDIGFFDSISLATSYKELLAMAGARSDENTEILLGSRFSSATLSNLGMKYLVTNKRRPDLEKVYSEFGVCAYRVPNPNKRVSFIPSFQITQENNFNLRIPLSYRFNGILFAERISSDQIAIAGNVNEDGFIHVLESWDPGWKATLNGGKIKIWCANGFTMAVPVKKGINEIILSYSTPGRMWGLAIFSGALFLGVLMGIKTRPLRDSNP